MGQHLVKFGGHWSNASGDIKYLTCHVTSQKQATEAQSNLKLFMVYVTNLPSLVATAIAVVEIMSLICHMIKQDHVIKESGDYNDKHPSR